jgi:hypothetical protein
MKKMIDKHYNEGTQKANSILMELVDMLIDYSPADGEKLLAYLREQRAVANDAGPGAHTAGPECTVYGDSQSAHNKEISASTRRAAKYLAENFAPKFPEWMSNAKMEHYERVKGQFVQRYGDKMEEIIERIYMDNAHFGIGHTVDEVLMAVLNWIGSEAERYSKKQPPEVFPVDAVLNRVGEELLEMENYCSSGLLSRVVNAIQGFTDGDTRLEIRISSREQVKTVVYHHLNKTLQECKDDEVLNGMDTGGQKYLAFVKTEIADRIPEWRKEYGDAFVEGVEDVVNEYTNVRTYS